MGISLDGLASGLDTTKLIDALMDVEAIPRTLLQTKIADKGVVVRNLQSLNTSLQDLLTQATKAAKDGSLTVFTTKSSSDAIRVTAGPEASPLATGVVVDRLATSHSVVTAASTTWPDAPPVLTIVGADGTKKEITAASSSMQDVAKAITAAGAGVTATTVAAGRNADGEPTFRLQLIATETGSAGAFQVYRGGVTAVGAGTATDLAAEPGAAIVTTGTDAQVRLWAGTTAEQVVTSSSNSFTALMPGVDITVSKTSAEPVTITVAPDAGAAAKTAGDFVNRIAAILSGIDKGSTATPGGPGEDTTLGVFTGDSTVRALRRALADAVQHPVDGVSPSALGISVDRHGVLTFDSTKFQAAMADDPAAVEKAFTVVATRVEAAADKYSDRYDGILTARITGQEREVDSLEKQVDRWDLRLDQRRETLERTYARLETMLAQMQSQSSYLTSQLSALPSNQGGQ